MSITKKFFSIILLFFIFLLGFTSEILAKDSTFASVIIPARGYDFWELEENPGTITQSEKNLIDEYGLKATFLLRPDFYLDNKISQTPNSDFTGHEVGVFFEITSKLADKAGVSYPKGEKSDANRFFLSGYSTEKREKLIDTAFTGFKEKYGYFPTSVGAWHIDSYSAEYMRRKYGVTAILLCADQYTTDRYRLWGAWWGVPYYPSEKNILVPAQGVRDKIDTVVTQWAVRDPINGYGGGLASLYSVQANDYTVPKLDLTTAYFNKLLDIYLGNTPFGHLTIGIENELFQSNKPEFEKQLIEIAKRQKDGSVKVITMSEFSDWYRTSFKGISKEVKISAIDPLGADKKATWIMNKDERIGLIEEGGKTFVRDFRNYKETLPEPFLLAPNWRADLWVETLGLVDSTRNPNSLVDVTGLGEAEIVSKFMPQKGIKFGLKEIIRILLALGFLAAVYKMKDKIKLHRLTPAVSSPHASSEQNPRSVAQSYDGVRPERKTLRIAYSAVAAASAAKAGHLRTYVQSFLRRRIKIEKKSLLLIILGSLTWSLTMIKSGMLYAFGMGFWGPNGHDGIWHIALAESLSRGSFIMPTFAGQIIKNYHIGFDLIIAILSRLTTIPVTNFYFQIIPPILALLVGYLTHRFTLSWTKSSRKAFWATFFVYFGGSLGWIFSLVRREGLGGESMFWAQQGISTLINPPFALSLVLVLIGLIILTKKEKRTMHYVLCALLFGSLIQIKVYAGLLVLGGLFVAGAYDIARNRKWEILKVFVGTLAVSLMLFLPFIRSSQNLVVFKPFWFLETMMGLSDRFGWQRFYSAMTNYRLGNIWIKAIPAYIVAFAIFWVGNMGTRLIKEVMVWKWMKNTRYVGWVEVFIASIILAGGIIPMFFVQSGTPWNTIQFFYYSLFFSAILAGSALGDILDNPKLKTSKIYIIEVAVVVLTIPTTIGTLGQYLPARPPARISNEELAGLSFLAAQPQGMILTYPFDRAKAEGAKDNPPRPLYLYESTAYVSAFSNKEVYLEDEVNLDITGYSWRERRAEIEAFYKSNSTSEVRNFLTNNNVSYIYWIRGQRAILGEGQLGLEKIFENQEVEIFKVK